MQVEEAIQEANEQWLESQPTETQNDTPPLPLIRLRVEHSGPFEVENPQRFSNKFVGKVANTTDIVQFYRKKKKGTIRRNATTIDEVVREEGEDEGEDSQEKAIRVENLVKEFLAAQTLSVLEENGLGEAIESFVDKDDKRALADFVEDTLKEHVEVFPFLFDVDWRIWLRVKLTRKILMRKFRKLKIDLLQRLLNGRNPEEIKRQQLTTMMTISLILLVHETI